MSRWLRGATRPSVETLRQLAPVLRKPLEELMVAAGHAQWHEFAGGRVPVSSELLRLLDEDDMSAEEKLSAIRAELAGGTHPGRAG